MLKRAIEENIKEKRNNLNLSTKFKYTEQITALLK